MQTEIKRTDLRKNHSRCDGITCRDKEVDGGKVVCSIFIYFKVLSFERSHSNHEVDDSHADAPISMKLADKLWHCCKQ